MYVNTEKDTITIQGCPQETTLLKESVVAKVVPASRRGFYYCLFAVLIFLMSTLCPLAQEWMKIRS
jgi:hypothetical protein